MAQALSVPVLFLSDPIVLPGMVVPIELDDAARAAVDAATASENGKLLIAPRLEDRYPSYGVLASIVQVGRIAGGSGTAAVVRGERRAHIGAGASGPGAALWVEVTEVIEGPAPEATIALAAEYKKLLLAMLQRREAWQIVDFVNKLTDPSALADTAGYASYLTDVQKRQLLETPDVGERLRALIDWTSDHLAEVEVNDKIAEDVREGMEKTQKEFLLRQQLAAIRKELGEGEPDGSDDYRARIEAADLPEKVREAALREVGKLERSSEQSPEGGWIRTWLDTVLDLPWNVTTEDSTDLKADPERSWTPTTTGWRTSRTASSSTWRCGRVARSVDCRSWAAAVRVRSWRWPARPVSARRRWVRASRVPWAASSSASPWAVCATRPRSVVTGAPTSAHCPAALCAPSARRGR